MDDELLKIYSLMKSAEDQLAALQRATDALMAERNALAQERAALKATLTEQANGVKAAATQVQTVAASLRQAAQDTTPTLQKAVREAVAASMRETLTETSTAAVRAVEVASRPFMAQLAEATAAAHTAEAALKNAGRWFAWKWVAVAAGGLVGVMLIAFLAIQAIAWSEERASMAEQQTWLEARNQWQAHVAQLQETAEALEQRTYGAFIVSGNDGVFLVAPKGVEPTRCKAGPCIRLQ